MLSCAFASTQRLQMLSDFLFSRLYEQEERLKPSLSAFDFQHFLYNLTDLQISNAGGRNCECATISVRVHTCLFFQYSQLQSAVHSAKKTEKSEHLASVTSSLTHSHHFNWWLGEGFVPCTHVHAKLHTHKTLTHMKMEMRSHPLFLLFCCFFNTASVVHIPTY